MTTKDFMELVVNPRLTYCKKLLSESKDKEYTKNNDKFYNFKEAARLRNKSKWEAIDMMWMKHVVSMFDILDDIQQREKYPSAYAIQEKFGDMINYILLVEGMITEELMSQMSQPK